MKKETRQGNRILVIGITLIVLLIPFGLYYMFWVLSHQAYFLDRSHRSLAGIGSQIASRIEGLRSVVENAAKKGCEGSDDLHDLRAYFYPLKPFGTELEYEPEPPKSETEKDHPESTPPIITLEFKRYGSAERLVLHYSCGSNPEFKQGQFSVKSATDALLEPVVDRFVFHDRRAAGEDVFDKVFVADAESGEVVFEYGLDQITIGNLENLLSPKTSDSINAKTTDAARTAPDEAGSPKTSTSQKPSEKTKANTDKRKRGSSDLTRITIADSDYKLFVQPVQLTVPKAGYGSEGLKLTVCGLVRSENLSSKSFSFSYTLLLFFILLVLVIIVSSPMVKLRLFGPKDRLKKTDAVLTAGSAFFGTALLVLTLLDVYAYLDLENQMDDQLQTLAANVDRNIRSELATANDQLDALNNKLGDDLSVADNDPDCTPASTCDKTGGATNSNEVGSAQGIRYSMANILGDQGILDPTGSIYPYFNTVMWSRRSGEQQIKFTTKRRPTAFVCVKDRRFFINANDGHLWNLSVDPPLLPLAEYYRPYRIGEFRGKPANENVPRKVSLYLEALNSRTSGENVAVISKLTPDKSYVSTLETRLLSLYQPVRPVGYGFCVIDSAGGVLFHTDDVKNLEENFFEECNQERNLRSAVKSRESDWLDVQYLGRAHRAFVTPIKDLPWTLVVFQDKQIARTVNLEIMTLTGTALAAYATAVIFVLALVFLPIFPKSGARLSRIWPDPRRLSSYKQLLIVNSALFVICLALVIYSSRNTLIVWAVLFPAVAIAHSLMLMGKKPRLRRGQPLDPHDPGSNRKPQRADARSYWRGLVRFIGSSRRDYWRKHHSDPKDLQRSRQERKAHARVHWRRSYVLAFVSMVAIGCVAPTIAFFKLIRDEQVRVFIRHGQMSLARGLERREDEIRSQYLYQDPPIDVGSAEVERDEFVARRLASTWDVYDWFFFRTKPEARKPKGGSPLDGPLCWFLTTFSPFYNETCVDSHGLVRGQASDTLWTAAENSDGLILSVRPTITDEGGGSRSTAGQPGGRDFGLPGLKTIDGTPDKTIQELEREPRPDWIFASVAPVFISFTNPLSWLLILFMGLVLLLTYFEVRFAAHRIVLLDLASPRSIFLIPPAGRAEKNYLIVRPPFLNHRESFPEEYSRIDLNGFGAEDWWRIVNKLDHAAVDKPIVIGGFEFRNDDAALNELKLQLVQQSLIQETRRVFIVSSVDPLAFPLSTGEASAPEHPPEAKKISSNGKPVALTSGTISNGNSAKRLTDVERWSLVLGSFARANSFEQANSQGSALILNAVAAGPRCHLESALSGELSDTDTAEMIAEEEDQADAYYQGAWSACSLEERCTLFRIAQDGLVSRRDPDLRRLMQWGLIVRDPSLRLMEESFRRFVLRTSVEEEINKYRPDVESPWERLKLPLLLVLLGAIAFLLLTQKELYDSTISLVTALTGGVLTLLRLFGMFQRSKGSNAA